MVESGVRRLELSEETAKLSKKRKPKKKNEPRRNNKTIRKNTKNRS